VLAGGDERDLASLHDSGDSHGYRLGRDVVLAEEIPRRVAARHGVQRDASRAGVHPRAGLVEADVSGLSDAQDLEIYSAGVGDGGLVHVALDIDLLARNVTPWNVDVLGPDVDVIEEILPHVPVIAVDAVRSHRVVFVEVERHNVRKVELFLAMHAYQLAIDADRRAAGGKPEHRVPARRPSLPDDLGDSPGDGARDLVVLDDDDFDSFLVRRSHSDKMKGNRRQRYTFRVVRFAFMRSPFVCNAHATTDNATTRNPRRDRS
jgi:hypothetical protein